MAEQKKRNGTTQRRRSDAVRGQKRTNAGNRQGRRSAGTRSSGRANVRKKRRRQRKTRAWIIGICILIAAVLVVAGVLVFGNKGKDIEEGTKLLEQGKYKEASEVFNTYLKEHTGADEDDVFYQAEASRGLGMAYYELKQYDKAIEFLNKAADLGGEMTPALYNLIGISAMNLEDYDSALTAFEKGCQLPATSVYTDADGKEQTADYTAVIQEMQFNRIVCFEKKLDWASAKAEMETYQTLYPDDETAKKEAEFLGSMQL